MKKILLFLIFVFGATIMYVSFAQGTTSSDSGYSAVQEDSAFGFSAVYEGGHVYMTWAQYSKSEALKYYKVVRSTTNSNPSYPEDGYISYNSDISFTKYVDLTPPAGYAYYRICAITKENNRYCSKVIKVTTKKVETPTVCTMEAKLCSDGSYVSRTGPNCEFAACPSTKVCSTDVKMCDDGSYVSRKGPNCEFAACPVSGNVVGGDKDEYGCIPSAGYSWCAVKNKCLRTWEEKCSNDTTSTSSYKIKVQIIVNNFIAKLDKKGFTSDQKVETINAIIDKLKALKESKPTLKEVIDYLIILLEEKRDKYKNDFSDIEKILNDF